MDRECMKIVTENIILDASWLHVCLAVKFIQ